MPAVHGLAIHGLPVYLLPALMLSCSPWLRTSSAQIRKPTNRQIRESAAPVGRTGPVSVAAHFASSNPSLAALTRAGWPFRPVLS